MVASHGLVTLPVHTLALVGIAQGRHGEAGKKRLYAFRLGLVWPYQLHVFNDKN